MKSRNPSLFEAHRESCAQCRKQPYALCPAGERALADDALSIATTPRLGRKNWKKKKAPRNVDTPRRGC